MAGVEGTVDTLGNRFAALELHPQTRGVTLLDIPDELLERIFLALVGTTVPRVLDTRAISQAEYAYNLASTCQALRQLFTSSFEQIALDWDTPVNISALARLFGKHIRSVLIRRHAHADAFLEALADRPCQLERMSLWSCPAPQDALQKIVKDSCDTLKSLDLHFLEGNLHSLRCDDINGLIQSLAVHTSNVERLTLHGMFGVTHNTIVSICASSGERLRHLGLRYLRNESVRDDTLASVASSCPGLQSITIEDVRNCTRNGIVRFCATYRSSLERVDISESGIRDEDVESLADVCPQVRSIGLARNGPLGLTASCTLQVCKKLAEDLYSIRLWDLAFMTDIVLQELPSACPNLQHVSLRHYDDVTDIGVIFLCRALGKSLQTLDLKGCSITDDALRAIGNTCVCLRVIRLGSDGCSPAITAAGTVRNDNNAISNEGMEALLKGVGANLRHFSWETPMRYASWPQQPSLRAVGVARLSAKALAKTLITHCPKLRVVHITGLRPPLPDRVERARCDLAFFELETQLPDVVVCLDRPEPLGCDWDETS